MLQFNHLIDGNILKGISKSSFHQRLSHSNTNINYYDVLNLKRDCSDKDIRESFVKLSKQHHPDTNDKITDGSQFAKIMEAYKVLGKSESRSAYDHSLQHKYSYDCQRINVEYDGQIFRPNRYGFADKRAGPIPTDAYYGVKGVKKVSNKHIVLFCLIFAGIGVTAQIIAIRHSFTLKRDELDRRSAEIGKSLQEIRSEAEKYSPEAQRERFLKRVQDSLK